MIMFGSMYYIVPRLVGTGMALRVADQASLLVLGLRSRFDGVDAPCGGLFARRERCIIRRSTFMRKPESILPMYLRGRSVLRSASDRLAFCFRISLWPDAFGSWAGRASVPTFLNPQEEEALEARL